MRIGLLGGTFNPVHKGHLLLAEGAKRILKLDQVLWIPARQSPRKEEADGLASPKDRAAMVEMAIRDHPDFKLSRIELERPAPSYTIDTIRQLQAQVKGRSVLWFLLIGSDIAPELPSWRQFDQLIKRVQFAVIPRPGHSSRVLPAGVKEIPVKTLNISSSEIRQRIREGRPIRSFVPEAVCRYIQERGLYRVPGGAG